MFERDGDFPPKIYETIVPDYIRFYIERLMEKAWITSKRVQHNLHKSSEFLYR